MHDVKDTRYEILTLQREILGLQETLQGFQNIFQRRDRLALADSRPLSPIKITECISDLQALEAQIDIGEREQTLSSLGLQAFPLKRTEVEGVAHVLEKYTSFMKSELYAEQKYVSCLATEFVQTGLSHFYLVISQPPEPSLK